MGVSHSAIIGGAGKRPRVEHDYYATPPETTELILREIDLSGSILEPACGEGHISTLIKKYYPQNEIVSTDLIDRGYGETGIDFLTHDYGRKFGTIITNPPFKLAKEFIEKSLKISTDKVIMFAKLQLLETKGRLELFRNSPLKYVYVHVERQSPWRNGSPLDEHGKPWSSAMCFAWFVWEHGYEGEPVVRFLSNNL